jgi:hypothetical protein
MVREWAVSQRSLSTLVGRWKGRLSGGISARVEAADWRWVIEPRLVENPDGDGAAMLLVEEDRETNSRRD